MDRSHDITAAADYVTIGGKQYEMRPPRWRDFGEAEKWMLKGRENALDIAIPRLSGLPEPLQKHLLELAWKESTRGEWLSRDSVIGWLTENYVGQVFAFWCYIRQAQPEITMDQSEQLHEQLRNEERAANAKPLDMDLGLPQGNSPSRTQNGEATTEQSPGEASVAT